MHIALKITLIVILFVVLAVGGFIGWAYYKMTHVKDTHDLQRQVDRLCSDFIQRKKTVGLCVGIIKDGRTEVYGYGNIARAQQRKPDSSTVFEIGSISKVFTATMAQILVDRGELSWKDPLNKYLPGTAHFSGGDSTTLGHLVTHTSGFPRLPESWFPFMTNDCDPYSTLEMHHLLDYLKDHQDKKNADYKHYDYSNLGMGLLGHILEWKTGKSYDSLLQELICGPLQLRNTSLHVADTNLFATGYDEKGAATCHWQFPIIPGAGGIRSDMSDMLRFLKANIGDSSALYSSLARTHLPVTTIPMGAIGRGWHIDNANGVLSGIREIVWHNGGTGGFRTYIGFVSGKQTGIVVWANQAAEELDALAIDLIIKVGTTSWQ